MSNFNTSLDAIIYRADTRSNKAIRWREQCGGAIDSDAQWMFDDCRAEYDHIVEHMINLKVMIQEAFG